MRPTVRIQRPRLIRIERERKRRRFRAVFTVLVSLAASGLIAAFLINQYVVSKTDKYIIAPDRLAVSGWAVVLGAKASSAGKPSPALEARVQRAVELMEMRRADGLILTGGEDEKLGREITAMYNYAVSKGIDKALIATDDSGYNTLASIKWAKKYLSTQTGPVIIVTQRFHLNRAVYIARKLGLEAYGVPADDPPGLELGWLSAREFVARIKDFFLTLLE